MQSSNLPNAEKIELILGKISQAKIEHSEIKERLKDFPIYSDHLRDLKQQIKDLNQAKEDEEKRIEAEFDEQEYKGIKEEERAVLAAIKSHIRDLHQLISEVPLSHDLEVVELKANGDYQKVQIERVRRVYINGKEQKI